MSKTKSTARLFLWPLLMGVMSIIGLISALVGDGYNDVLSWAMLTIPIAVSGLFSCRGK